MACLMMLIFLQFFASHYQPLLFSCQVALLVIELQLLVGALQKGSKGSGDGPCYVPEHTPPILPVSFCLGILGL